MNTLRRLCFLEPMEMVSRMMKSPLRGVVGLDVGTEFVGVVRTCDMNQNIAPIGCYVIEKNQDYFSSICQMDKNLSYLIEHGSAGDLLKRPGLGFVVGFPSASPSELLTTSSNFPSCLRLAKFMDDWETACLCNHSLAKFWTLQNEYGSTRAARMFLADAYVIQKMRLAVHKSLTPDEKKRQDVMSGYIITREFLVGAGVPRAQFDNIAFACRLVKMINL